MSPKRNNDEVLGYLKEASDKYDIPYDLLVAQARQESGFNPLAKSKVGAQGVMQLMPATAKALGVTNAFDPQENIDAGARYLKQQHNKFGDWGTALAAYNAGPGNVQKYGGIPPFKETRGYVKNIMSSLGKMVEGEAQAEPMYSKEQLMQMAKERGWELEPTSAPAQERDIQKNPYSKDELMKMAKDRGWELEEIPQQSGVSKLLNATTPLGWIASAMGNPINDKQVRSFVTGAARGLPGSDLWSAGVGTATELPGKLKEGMPLSLENIRDIFGQKYNRFKETSQAIENKAPYAAALGKAIPQTALFATGEGLASQIPGLATVEGAPFLANLLRGGAQAGLGNVLASQAEEGIETPLSERLGQLPKQASIGALAQMIPAATGKGLQYIGGKALESGLGKKAAGMGADILEKFGLTKNQGSLAAKNLEALQGGGEDLNALLQKHSDKLVPLPENLTHGDIMSRAEKAMLNEDWKTAEALQNAANFAKQKGGLSPEMATDVKRALDDEAYSLASGEAKNTVKAKQIGKLRTALKSNIENALGPEGKALAKINKDLSQGLKLKKILEKNVGKSNVSPLDIGLSLGGGAALSAAHANPLLALAPFAYKFSKTVPGATGLAALGKLLQESAPALAATSPALSQ